MNKLVNFVIVITDLYCAFPVKRLINVSKEITE